MNRRSRAGRRSRQSKYWTDGAAPLPPVAVDVSARAHAERAGPADPMVERVLAALASRGSPWAGDPAEGGTTTGEVASMIGVRPGSPERARLNATLTEMRLASLLHYEFDRAYDREVRWWTMEKRLAVEATLP